MRGIHNILYLVLIAALATNNFTVNNLFSSIEKKDASSHLFDDEEDGGYVSASMDDFLPFKRGETYTFYKVNGDFITLAANTKTVLLSTLDRWATEGEDFTPIGSLIGFKDATGKWFLTKSTGTFKEYNTTSSSFEENGAVYTDSLTLATAPTSGIVSFFKIIGGDLKPVAFEINSPINQSGHNFSSNPSLDKFILFESDVNHRLPNFGSINDYVTNYALGQVVELSSYVIREPNSDIYLQYRQDSTIAAYQPAQLKNLSIADIFYPATEISVFEFLLYERLMHLRSDEIENFKDCFEGENNNEVELNLSNLRAEIQNIINENAYMNSGNLSNNTQDFESSFKIRTAEALGKAIAVSSDPLQASNLHANYLSWKDNSSKTNDFAGIINGLHPCALLNITPQNRVDYLEYLNTSQESISAKEKLLENISSTEEKDVYDLLIANDQELLTELVWNDADNALVVDLLTALLIKYHPIDGDALLSQDKLINLSYNHSNDLTTKSRIEPTFTNGLFTFKVCIKKEGLGYQGPINDNNCDGWYDNSVMGGNRHEIDCKPGDFILIHFAQNHPDYSQFANFISVSSNEEEFYLVPAIYANMIFNDVYDEFMSAQSRQLLLTAGLLMGVSELAIALETAQALHLTFAAIDLGIVGFEIALDAGLEQEILSMSGGQQFLNAWHTVVGIYTMGRLGSVLITPQRIKNVRDAIKNLRNNNSNISNQVDDYVDDVANKLDELEGTAMSSTTTTTRSLDEICPNGEIPPNSTQNNQFYTWFDELSVEELDLVLQDANLSKTLFRRIRWPKNQHEWCMVCHIRKFKEWNIPMEEIHRFRTSTETLVWTVPDDVATVSIRGMSGGHGATGSTTFHNELSAITSSSDNLVQFNQGLTDLIARWQIDPNLIPPLIKL